MNRIREHKSFKVTVLQRKQAMIRKFRPDRPPRRPIFPLLHLRNQVIIDLEQQAKSGTHNKANQIVIDLEEKEAKSGLPKNGNQIIIDLEEEAKSEPSSEKTKLKGFPNESKIRNSETMVAEPQIKKENMLLFQQQQKNLKKKQKKKGIKKSKNEHCRQPFNCCLKKSVEVRQQLHQFLPRTFWRWSEQMNDQQIDEIYREIVVVQKFIESRENAYADKNRKQLKNAEELERKEEDEKKAE